MICNNFWV